MLFYVDLVIHQCKEEFSDEVNNFNSTEDREAGEKPHGASNETKLSFKGHLW